MAREGLWPILTVPDLIFGNLALLFNVETAHKEVPFALVASGRGDANLGGRWRWHTLHTCNTNMVLANLLHIDVGDIGCNVAVVVEWSLDLIEQL
jgi:hypothetical protein